MEIRRTGAGRFDGHAGMGKRFHQHDVGIDLFLRGTVSGDGQGNVPTGVMIAGVAFSRLRRTVFLRFEGGGRVTAVPGDRLDGQMRRAFA